MMHGAFGVTTSNGGSGYAFVVALVMTPYFLAVTFNIRGFAERHQWRVKDDPMGRTGKWPVRIAGGFFAACGLSVIGFGIASLAGVPVH